MACRPLPCRTRSAAADGDRRRGRRRSERTRRGLVLARAGWGVTVLEAASRPRRRHAHRSSSPCPACCTTCARRSIRWRSARLRSVSSATGDRTLADHGLEWVHPDVPLAHPLDGGRAAVLARDVDDHGRRARRGRRRLPPPVRTARRGRVRPDRRPALALHDPAAPPAGAWPATASPASAARAVWLAAGSQTDEARALFAGLSGHSILPLDSAGHRRLRTDARRARPRRRMADGSRRLAADRRCARRPARRCRRPGRVRHDRSRRSPSCRPPTRSCSMSRRASCWRSPATPLPSRYRTSLDTVPLRPRRLQARLGARRPDPVDQRRRRRARRPSTSAARSTRSSPSEAAPHAGQHAERPYVLLAQQSLFDPDRAPAGTHTAWAYCHVPNGSTVDMTDRIEAQVERFAPGFRDRDPRPPHDGHRRRSSATTPTTSAATSTVAAAICASSSCARRSACTRGARRSTASTCARAARHRAAACTACADGTPPTRCCVAPTSA